MCSFASRGVGVVTGRGSPLHARQIGKHLLCCQKPSITSARGFSQVRCDQEQTRGPVQLGRAEGDPPSIFHDIRKSFKAPFNMEDDSTDWSRVKNVFLSCQQSDAQDGLSRQCVHCLRPDVDRFGSDGKKSVFVRDKPRSQELFSGGGYTKSKHRSESEMSLPIVMQGFYGKMLDPYPFAAEKLAAHMNPLGQVGGAAVTFPFAAVEWQSGGNKEKLTWPDTDNANSGSVMLSNLYHLFWLSEQEHSKALESTVEQLAVLTSIVTPFQSSLFCHWIETKEAGGKRFLQQHVNERVWDFPERLEEASRQMISASNWLHDHLKPLVMAALGKIETRSKQEPALEDAAASMATRRVVSADGFIL